MADPGLVRSIGTFYYSVTRNGHDSHELGVENALTPHDSIRIVLLVNSLKTLFKVFIFSSRTLGDSVTDQIRVQTFVRASAVEILGIGTGCAARGLIEAGGLTVVRVQDERLCLS